MYAQAATETRTSTKITGKLHALIPLMILRLNYRSLRLGFVRIPNTHTDLTPQKILIIEVISGSTTAAFTRSPQVTNINLIIIPNNP